MLPWIAPELLGPARTSAVSLSAVEVVGQTGWDLLAPRDAALEPGAGPTEVTESARARSYPFS